MKRRVSQTAYRGLAAVVLLLLLSPGIAGAQPVQSGQSVDVTARVCDEQNAAPSITAPASGSTYQASVARFEGTAGAGRTVTLVRNNLNAGTALVDSTGRWQLQLTLVQGTNTVTAKDCYDSAPVTVFYLPASPPPPEQPGGRPALQPAAPAAPNGQNGQNGASGQQGAGLNGQPGQDGQSAAGSASRPLQPAASVQNALEAVQAVPRGSFFLTVDVGVYNLKAGETGQFSVTVNGGNGPFTVRWDWGDGSTTEQRSDARGVITPHKFESSGTYQVQTTVTDRDGREATITSAVTVAAADAGTGTRAEPSRWTFWVMVGIGLVLLLALLALLRRHKHHHTHPHLR